MGRHGRLGRPGAPRCCMAVSLAVVAVVLAARAAALVLRGLRAGRPDRARGRRARRSTARVLRLPLAARAGRRRARGAARAGRRACSARTGSARRSGSCSSRCGAGGSPPARAGGGRRPDGPRARGRVALVTGGSKGIGFGIAAGLAAEGARVAVASRDAERIRAAADRIGAHPVVFDSDDLDAVPGVIDDVEAALGPIDVYVANTGGPPGGRGPARLHARAVGGRAPDARPLADGLPRAAAAGHARAWLGSRRRGRLAWPCASRSPRLQLSNAHRPGLVAAFKVLARQAAARRRDAQHRPARPDRHRPDLRLARLGARRPRRRRARPSPPAGSARVEELAAAAVFLCSAPAALHHGHDAAGRRRAHRVRLSAAR